MAGPSRSEYDNFLKANPNDQHRYASAHGYQQADVDAMLGGGGGGSAYASPLTASHGRPLAQGTGSQIKQEYDSFLQNNPNDQHRFASAYGYQQADVDAALNPQQFTQHALQQQLAPSVSTSTQQPNASPQEIAAFLQANPGDEHRLVSAFGAAPSQDGSVPASTSTPVQPPVTAQPTTGASESFAPYTPPAPNVPPNLEALVPDLFNAQAPSPLDAQMQEALQGLLTRSQAPVSIDDPQLQPASDTFRASQQRGAERMRSQTAERAAQTGTLESGGFDTEALGYAQDANFASSANDSSLVLGEMDKRREDLRQGISLAMASGQFDKQQALQRQLALLDAAQQQQSFGLAQELGRGDLGLRRELGIGDLGLRTELGRGDLDLRTLLGKGGLDLQGRSLDINKELGLGDLGVRQNAVTQQGQLGRGSLALDLIRSLMQNDQFYSGLGLDAGKFQATLNQDAIANLLRGFQ